MKKGMRMLAAAATGVALAWSPASAAGDSDSEFAARVNAVGEAALQEALARPDASVLRDQTTELSVALNPETVKCSAADYSMPTLKVLIPALAQLTVLNHRNTNEGAPCLAAGSCQDTGGPDTILRSGNGVDRIRVRVTLKKTTEIDGDVCHVSLVETVTTAIRGTPFSHQRQAPLPDRVAADCK